MQLARDVLVQVKTLEHFDQNLGLPEYASAGAAGADIKACLGKGESLVIKPGQKVLVPTGLSFEIPEGHEIQVRPRSGLSFKTGLMVVNSPGTIDCDYRGELKIILGNLGQQEEVIHHGDRIAQILLAPVWKIKWHQVESLEDTQRGVGGFGSTGRG